MAVDWAFALLFMIAAVGYLVMNGRAWLRYLRGLASRVFPLSREAVAALAITAGLLLLAGGHTRLHRAHDVRGAERERVDAVR
jgi:uncharacterized membrane protein YidH (DUF202 family)